MRSDHLKRIHERLRGDLGGPRTPVEPALPAEERESLEKRLWGPMARPARLRRLIDPRWQEYKLKRRLELEASFRRYVRSLIDTFWAGYPEAERRGLEQDVLAIYLDPAEETQAMPFTLGFVIHQAVHLVTTDEEFTARLVHQLITAATVEAFGKKKIPAAWDDPVVRETFPWWGDLLEAHQGFWGLIKHWRGNRIYYWLGARTLALHREGRPLAGRFADLYLFFRCHLSPTRAHLLWIDEACARLSALRAPGDSRPLERGEVEAAWEALPWRAEALKAGAIELMLQGGFVTDHFFGAADVARL